MEAYSYLAGAPANWHQLGSCRGEEAASAAWSREENKIFENALAVAGDGPDRWVKVAEELPGRSVIDIWARYLALEKDIEHIDAGLVPLPGYILPPPPRRQIDFELDRTSPASAFRDNRGMKRPAPATGSLPEPERKKVVPWTEDEHRKFLMGLKKYGKGDWRSISRSFVTTRTPTQVASHAQKYFIRLSSGGKDKRRSSIHDITTANLPDESSPSPPLPLAAAVAAAPCAPPPSNINPIAGPSLWSAYGIGVGSVLAS